MLGDHPGSFLADLVGYLVSTAARGTANATKKVYRRHRFLRRVRRTVSVDGIVELLRPIRAPVSGDQVAACRVIVRRRLDDGTWAVIYDESRLGEIELIHGTGRIRPGGSVDLIARPSQQVFGEGAVVWGCSPKADYEDLEAIEYAVRSGDHVWLLGLTSLPSQPRWTGDPYRSGDQIDVRWSTRPLISAWPKKKMLRLIRQRPDLLPPPRPGSQT